MSIQQAQRPLALVLGVANARSIAWSCVRSFLNNNYDVILMYQNEKIGAKVERMMYKHIGQQQQQHNAQQQQQHPSLTGLICDVQHDIPKLFQHVSQHHRPLHAIVHSVAFANNLHRPLLNTTLEDYCIKRPMPSQHAPSSNWHDMHSLTWNATPPSQP